MGISKAHLSGDGRKWGVPGWDACLQQPTSFGPVHLGLWCLLCLSHPHPHHLILIFLCVAILSLCWIEAVSLRQGIQPIRYVDSIKYETFINTKPPFLHHCSLPVELFMHFIIGTFPTQFLPCSLFQHRFLIQLLILCSSSDFSCPYTKPDIACCKGSWRNEWL